MLNCRCEFIHWSFGTEVLVQVPHVRIIVCVIRHLGKCHIHFAQYGTCNWLALLTQPEEMQVYAWQMRNTSKRHQQLQSLMLFVWITSQMFVMSVVVCNESTAASGWTDTLPVLFWSSAQVPRAWHYDVTTRTYWLKAEHASTEKTGTV